MNPTITISEREIKNKQDFVSRSLQKRYPLDKIDVNQIIYDPLKTVRVGNDGINCTFTYKDEIIQVQPGPLFFDEITTPADKKIKSWHDSDKVLNLIDEICRVANVAKQNVVVKKADQSKMLMVNVQMPNTLRRSFVNTMTLCVNSRKFKVEFHDDWHKIIEINGHSKTLLSIKYKEGLTICPKHIVTAGYQTAKSTIQDLLPFSVFHETTITSTSPHKHIDKSWDLYFYDESNCQFQVKVTAEGIATCREALATKPPKVLLDHIKAAGYTSIRITRCELKAGVYNLTFQLLTGIKGYRATMSQDGEGFLCEDMSLGPACVNESGL